MKTNGDSDKNSLECCEKKLQKEKKDANNALFIARDILAQNLINNLTIAERGEHPDFLRYPNAARRGEEWFRNRLLWLRTIPLEKDISFMITHSETAVYYEGSKGKRSADLLGIWHSGGNTKLGVIELKAGKNGDHVLYAILEGLRNLHLHRKAIGRLRSGWTTTLNQRHHVDSEKAFWSRVWNSGNPFPSNLKNSHLIIIGDSSWIKMQEDWKRQAKIIIKKIKEIFNYETSIYSLNDKAKSNSKPYVLLPLVKWL